MHPLSELLQQGNAARFRVIDAAPYPYPANTLRPADELLFTVEYLDPPEISNIGVPAAWLAPYREAIRDAIRSGAVYEVDLTFSTHNGLPRLGDTVLHRLLNAVLNRQIVDEPINDA